MNNKLYAPQVDHYIDWLGNRNYGYSNNQITYDEKSYENIDKFFDLIKKISPISQNGCRELWFCIDRGTIDAFGNYEEMLADGEVENYQEFEKMWKDWFPDEKKWYRVTALNDEETNYKAIVINYNFVIVVDAQSEKGYPHDISDFTNWLYLEAKNCIKQMENGTYMDFVKANIPSIHKTGTILQKELWELYPDDKKEFFDEITDEDIIDFMAYVSNTRTDDHKPTKRLKTMTANDFFKCCSLGYKAMGYKGTELSPKEQYKMHADGRDEGLTEIDENSPDDFEYWLTKRERFGGHPWEVCRGGNSTHISLSAHKDEKGYFLYLAGSSYGRTNETIKFYLSLCRTDIPVYLNDGSILIERVLGTEKVGVVPQGVIPKYRSGDFPNEEVISYMNLPYENTELVAEKCIWQDIKNVYLLEKEDKTNE